MRPVAVSAMMVVVIEVEDEDGAGEEAVDMEELLGKEEVEEGKEVEDCLRGSSQVASPNQTNT